MAILIIIYTVFLLAFAIYSAAGIYHLWRFGYIGDLTKPAIVAYIVLSGLVIIFSIIAMIIRFSIEAL